MQVWFRMLIANSCKVTNTKSIDVQIQKNAYIDKSLQTSKEYDSKANSQEIRMPYRHPNHKIRYFNQSMYQQKQIIAMSKNITSTTSVGQNRSYQGSRIVSHYFQEPYKNPNP